MMMKKHFKKIIFIGYLSVLVSACTSDNTDLVNYMNDVKSRPPKPIEPMPQFAPLPIFRFPEDEHRRNPFQAIDQSSKKELYAPDQKRVKEPLEFFPLDSLQFVGTFTEGHVKWALIRDPNKIVIPVKIGSYLGKNYGRVISITSDIIKLEETVKNSGGWQKRITTIHLDTSK